MTAKISSIGKNIKTLRKRMGFKQVNIAHFLGVKQSLISNVEKGEVSLSTDMLEKLSCLFGVSVDSIETGKFDALPLTFSFNPANLTVTDMEAISAINRIAINSEYMAKLLEGSENG